MDRNQKTQNNDSDLFINRKGKQMKKHLSSFATKLLRLMAAFVVAISTFGTRYVSEVHASTVVQNFWPYEQIIMPWGPYWITNALWEVDGHYAFCADGMGAGPVEGDIGTDAYEIDDAELRKVLYYGYAGPGNILGMYNEAQQIIITNELASYARHRYTAANVATNDYHWNAGEADIWYDMMSRTDPKEYGYAVFGVQIQGQGTNWAGDWTDKQELVYVKMNNKTVNVAIEKVTANPKLSDGNYLYSLEGAKFGVYRDSGCTNKLGEITTNTEGKGSASFSVPASVTTVYMKELVPPKGYELNSAVVTGNLTNNSTSVRFEDQPQNDPLRISLEKISQDETVAENPAPLEGAQFTIKYYAKYGTEAEILESTPTRTWIIQTKKSNSGKYYAILDEEHLVSGSDELFTVELASGEMAATIPLGTITVQETIAPEGYLLEGATLGNKSVSADDNGMVFMEIRDDGTSVGRLVGGNEYSVADASKRGALSFKKVDVSLEEGAEGNGTLKDAEFTIVNDNDYDVEVKDGDTVLGTMAANGGTYVVKTDENGEFKSPDNFLSVGKYTLVETTPSEGYTIYSDYNIQDAQRTENTYSFEIPDHDHREDLGELPEQPKEGRVRIEKQDEQTGGDPQGDVKSLRAVFDLYNRSKQAVVVNGTIYEPNDLIMTFATDDSGVYEMEEEILPYGTYEVIEMTPPVGYQRRGHIQETFSLTEDHQLYTISATDKVVVGRFKINKEIYWRDRTDPTEPEAGAEFAAILKSYVDEVGDFDTAYANVVAGTSGLTEMEYSIITTDAAGNATSGELAYGEYLIGQTKTSSEEIKPMEGTKPFKVSYEAQPDEEFKLVNYPYEYLLKIVKKDAKTGRTVTLNSAQFQILDENDETVELNVARFVKDTFQTVSKNGKAGATNIYYEPADDEGSVLTPEGIFAGNYKIVEVEIPDGFNEQGEPLKVPVNIHEAEVDENGKPILDENGYIVLEVVIENEQPTGTLELTKKIKDYTADKTFINRDDLSGIQFTLTAKEDIIDAVDGSVITAAGEAYGVYNCEKDGSLKVEEIPLGKYELTETAAPAGIVKDETVYDVVFEQEDTVTVEYTVSEEVMNDTTKIEVSKKKVTGDDELPGASLTVTDKDGNVVDEWTSTDKPHTIEGLTAGETYTLTEDLAPIGYVKASSIDFTVAENGDVTHVEMKDSVVTVSKKTLGGDEVIGAKMEVRDEEGNVIDTWESDGKEHMVDGLEEGKKYVLYEVVAPKGYVKATEIPFTVSEGEAKVDQHIDMTDLQITLTKEDGEGHEVPGSHIQIIDEEGNVVDEWTSTEEPHIIENLEEGKTYTMHEEGAPDGYYYAEDDTFTVTKDGVQDLVMIDKPIRYEILKVDDETGAPVAGVTLELYDITDATEEEPDGEKIGEWITDGNPIDLTVSDTSKTVLIAGHSYRLVESEIVAGVFKATDILFTVDKYNPESDETVTITMVDLTTWISVLKVDDKGNPLEKAEMQLFEATEKKTVDEETGEETVEYVIAEDAVPLYEWISTKEPEDISDYVKGDHWYVLRESEAPFGFNEIHDMPFQVTGKIEVAQLVLAVDQRKDFYVAVTKVDAKDESKRLSGAEFTVYNAKTNEPVKTVTGAEVKAVTGADGIATFHLTFSEDGYYVKETAAPAGYKLNSQKFAVTLSETYDFAKENPIKITVKDDGIPNTGVGVPIAVGGMGILALALAVLLNKKQLFSK